MRRLTVAQLVLLAFGVAGWAHGTARLNPSSIGPYGILASAGPWFLLGLGAIVAGFLLESSRESARGWMLGAQLVVLIVAIHTTVPIVFGTPEYAWTYKHIGVTALFQEFGRVTDPSSIYQEWPVMFAGSAALANLGHIGALSFAAWAPVAFELGDALLLLAAFRLLVDDRRVAYLAVLLYEGLISWVGQDYFSPQAFAYLLWLGVVVVILRWLRAPVPATDGRFTRWRAPLIAELPSPPVTTPATRTTAVVLVITLYSAIVTSHQLTPYLGLAAIAGLVVLGLMRPWWLLVLLAALTGGFLVLHYSLISEQFGGLFSGGNPLANASGVRGASHAGAEATTALVVRGLAAAMWLLTIGAIARWRRQAGQIMTPAVLAFTPFLMLVGQRYGGEAVYRVYMFSAPWCALLIVDMLLRARVRLVGWSLAAIACGLALAAGLQGLYGPVAVRAFTRSEMAASNWMYAHLPVGSLIVLPANDFPVLQTANYDKFDVQPMPSDPQLGPPWLDEADLAGLEQWIHKLGYDHAYVVRSRSMDNYERYFGFPRGYAELLKTIATTPYWSLIYRNADTRIYRLTIT